MITIRPKISLTQELEFDQMNARVRSRSSFSAYSLERGSYTVVRKHMGISLTICGSWAPYSISGTKFTIIYESSY